jgi:hypothetical protein
MTRSTRYWVLRERLPLLRAAKGRLVGLRLKVGSDAIAVADSEALCFVLSRKDLGILWQGRAKGLPYAWADAGRLLMRLGAPWGPPGVWDVARGKASWRAAGQLVRAGNSVVLQTPSGEIEIRDIATGKASRRLTFEGPRAESLGVVADVLMRAASGHVHAIQLPSGEVKWRLPLREAFEGLPHTDQDYCSFRDLGGSRALVKWGGRLGLLDADRGELAWRTHVPTDQVPAVSDERIGFLFSGHLVLLAVDTGETVAKRDDVTPTLWERKPCVHGEAMVVVDEGGHIATVRMTDGRVLGVQQERSAQFNDCATVDGRLLAAGLDGALWVYEPAGAKAVGTGAKAPRRAGNVPPLKPGTKAPGPASARPGPGGPTRSRKR